MFGSDATREWADSLKAGDEVYVSGNVSQSIRKVDRVTATTIIVGGTKFRKDGCSEIGGSRWHSANIYPATDERKNDIREKRRRQNAENAFSRLTRTMREYSTEQLEAVNNILEPKEQPNATSATGSGDANRAEQGTVG